MGNGRLLTVVVLAASALAAGCDSGASPQQQKAPAAALPTVTVSTPVRREIVEWDEYTGRFDSIETVELRARVSGHLNEVHFKDGQFVNQGDLLFVIDPRPFERTLEQAQAELLQATTRVENANLDVTRGRPLLERRVISEKSFDDRENLVRDAQAAVKVAQAKVKTAELDLSFTRITSPLAGRISRNQVSIGNWVSAGGVANTTLLSTIVSQDPIHIYFDVSENNYIKYKRLAERGEGAGAADVGATVLVALPDERGFPHKGTLDFLDNRLDQSTGTLRARAVVSNKSGLFSPGLFARVRVTGSAKYTALLLPEEAIGTDQTNKFVYVVGDDGMVGRRNVQLGPAMDGLRVVREGVAAGEWLITKGMQRARPGQSVTANRVAQAGEGGAPEGKAQQ
jgi:RND family efflux transporter MFP subunit